MTGPPQGRQRILARQRVRTRDGVELCTDVYLPAGDGPHPAVLVRTPYGRATPVLLRLALRLAHGGQAVALQDCRGRNQSGGEADWRREEDDGYDTLAWLGAQPWCDGRIGLVGISVGSLSLFPLAAGRPPDGTRVGAMVNVMGAVDFRSLFYRGGALVLHWALPWMHLMAARETTRPGWQQERWRELYRHLPLAEVPVPAPFEAARWRDLLAHPDGGEPWAGLDAGERLTGVRVPTLHLTGWYDFMLGQTLAAFRGMTRDAEAAGRGDAGRPAQRLVVGPWDHQSLFAGATAGTAGEPAVDVLEVIASWFGRWLGRARWGGARRGGDGGGDVLLYVVGADRWLGLDRFPPPGAAAMDWYLTSRGGANTADGDGELTTERPAAAAEDRFSYDPDDPAPTVGGAIWPFEAAGLSPGRADQSAVERRADVLVYTSPPLADDLVVAGPVEVELWADSSAPATDFTAKLVDVDPHGAARWVQDGIVRARPQAGGEAAGAAPRRFTVDLTATAQLFPRGHRLRLEVSSSSFPQFDRHLNTDRIPGLSAERAVARQRIFHGGERPSRLRLTVVPREQLATRRVDAAAVLGRRAPSGRWAGRLGARLRAAFAGVARRVGGTIQRQTAKPTGALGWVVGKLLVRANRQINRWTVAGLDVGRADRVLEIGFGPGFSVRELSRLAVDGAVAGIDHSAVMLREARRRNAKAVGEGRVDLRLGSVSALPFADASFDRVLAVNSIQLWPRPLHDLAEVRRVMRPGGRIALTFGQPGWAASEGNIKTAGRQTVANLAGAGFLEVSIEFRRLGRLYAFRAVARAPGAGDPAAG